MKKNRLVYVLIAIIIIAWVINISLNKFVFSLAYDSSIRMDIYIGKDYNIEEVKTMAKEVLEQEVLIQKVENFNDMVAITAREIPEEKQQAIIDKINEKYGVEAKKEETQVTYIPHYNGTDLMRRYIYPIIISAILIIIYVMFRYARLGALKIASETIIWSGIIELLYVSIISLARIPVSFYTIPLGIIIEIITLVTLMNDFEKDLLNKKREDKKKSKKEE